MLEKARPNSGLEQSKPPLEQPGLFDSNGSASAYDQLTPSEQEACIQEGLYQSDFDHPIEGRLYNGKPTQMIDGLQTHTAWWRWQDDLPGMKPRWVKDSAIPFKREVTASDRRLAEQEADEEWERKDRRGGAW